MQKFLFIAAMAAILVSCGNQTPREGMYTEFKLPSPEGKELKLSKTVKKNDLTLLDFWASWCGPCMMELPYLKAAYDEYKDKGFEIFAVSYDNNAEAWKGAIERNNMNWVHVSSLQGWNCPTQPMYGVYSIPRNLLIDKKGMIVAENLRGEELAAKLAELLP
jgi:thiol-disulfide isomerase/thioredoxin